MSKPRIDTTSIKGTLENVWISDLNYLMIKIYCEDRKNWITYNLGLYDPTNNIFTTALQNRKNGH
jgi:hypothetical protein